ncbi:MAG: protein kinase, partial [Planctomycetaceae bacterium]|nr:protein kinase [Planctomycetaceae bacterium]
MSRTIFVSQALHDRELVEARIYPALSRMGFKILSSVSDMEKGIPFRDRVGNIVDESGWFLVALSENSVESDRVRQEVALAMSRLQPRIVPILITPCNPTQCHFRLAFYPPIDLIKKNADGLNQLQTTLNSPPKWPSIMGGVLDELIESKLLMDSDLNEMETRDLSDYPEEEFVDRLVEMGKLTQYQADVISKRRAGFVVLGDYLVEDLLCWDGICHTYKAFDRRLHRRVAIKMPLAANWNSTEQHERFRRESITLAQLQHPNIVTVYGAGEYEGCPYQVMEYVEGGDLKSIVRRNGPLPVAKAVNYIIQTARGMEYAHNHNIVHLDLKPGNLVLANSNDVNSPFTTDACVKILGLGWQMQLVKESEDSDLDLTGMLLGTVNYMAPEQAMEIARADHR